MDEPRDFILNEFVKSGYNKKGKNRTWHVHNNPNLLFLTPELAKAFLDLRKVPVYRKNVIDKEHFLIKKSSEKLTKILGKKSFNLIDMRCADGERASTFIRELGKDSTARYCPIGMHPDLWKEAIYNVQKLKFKNVLGYKPNVSSYEGLFDVPTALRNSDFQSNVILILGSTLALFDINDFLFNLSRNMFEGDLLVIGNGIRSGKRLAHLETYKSEAFNDWFIHLLREIGFKDSEVEYDARFGKLRIECFYTLKTDKTIEHKGKKIEFKKGDEILVATIYKYFEKELKKFCKMYFSKVDLIKDPEEEYVLILCQK